MEAWPWCQLQAVLRKQRLTACQTSCSQPVARAVAALTVCVLDHARGLEPLHELALRPHDCRGRGEPAAQLPPLRLPGLLW